MIRRSLYAAGALAAAWTGYRYFDSPSFDQVILSNTPGSESGVLVVGQATPPMVYKSYVSTSGSFQVGPLSHSSSNNQVVAFTNQRAVAVKNSVNWTTGADTINMPLTGPIVIDVTFWVVRGNFQAQRRRALELKIAAAAIWDRERMGVTFGAFDVRNATTNLSGALFSNFDNCNMKLPLQIGIGKDHGRINIYMVDLVWGSNGRGQACGIGSDFVAIASVPGDALLAHEIGHDFALEHIDGMAGFDETNVMHSASDTRQYFTEGQIFRAHMAPLSALNAVYQARPGQPTRACPQSTSNATCPPIGKRIWADGTFQPN